MNEQQDKVNQDYLLSRYLDGELTRTEEAQLQRLLTRDGELRQELRRYSVLDEQLQAMGQAEPQDIDYDAQRADIIAAVERKVLLEGPLRRRLILRPAVRILAAAAALLIVASVGVLIFISATEKVAPVVKFTVTPETFAIMGVSKSQMEMKQLDETTIAFAPLARGTPTVPPGTVLVSIGARQQLASSLFPLELFGIE